MGAKRLFFFKFNSLGDDFGRDGARFTEIGAMDTGESFEAAGFVGVEFSPESRQGWFTDPAVGKNDLVLSELFEKLVNGFGLDIGKDDGIEKIGPKNAPFNVVVIHGITSFDGN